jgi:DNA-binding MarR family transcriptional regulator
VAKTKSGGKKAAKRDGGSSSSQELVGAFYDWIAKSRTEPDMLHSRGFEEYFHGVSEARYVIRKVFRIVDDQAKQAGLEPLEHQALIQIFGSPKPLRVIEIAERLDIPPAFASRLAIGLEEKGLVTRSRSGEDKRSTHVETTDAARDILAAIDQVVGMHVDYFQRQLSEAERASALGIFAFYVGASRIEDFEQLIEQVKASAAGRSSD